jgi:hypothetical protein
MRNLWLFAILSAALAGASCATSRQDGKIQTTAEANRESLSGAAAGMAAETIPFRGWVRKLTGAEQHDRLVQAAIAAGAVRRGYLKGLGEARGCDPPATPSHVLAGTPPPTQKLKPKYPTRLEESAEAPPAQAASPQPGPRP